MNFFSRHSFIGAIIEGIILLMASFYLSNYVLAQQATQIVPSPVPAPVTVTVEETGSGLLEGVATTCRESGQCNFGHILIVIANVFHLLRQIAFYAAIGFGLYGGIRMIVSQGKPEGVKEGKPEGVKAGQKIIEAAFIGLIIVYGASFIINIVCTILLGYPLTLGNILKANWLR